MPCGAFTDLMSHLWNSTVFASIDDAIIYALEDRTRDTADGEGFERGAWSPHCM